MASAGKGADNSERPETLLKQDLKLRGWTDAVIRDWLGEPDERVKRSPHSRYPPYCRYLLSRVEEAERHPDFAKRLEQARIRSRRGRLRAQEKTDKLCEWARSVPIRWSPGTPSTYKAALRQGTEAWEAWQYVLADRHGDYRIVDGHSADLDTRKRWARNFLRHECLEYDDLRLSTHGLTGTHAAREILHQRCMEKIGERFPQLATQDGRPDDSEAGHTALFPGF